MISPCCCWTRPSHSANWKNPSACPQSPASPGGTNAGWQDGGRPKLVSNGSASLGSTWGKSHITGVWGWASKPKGEGRGWKGRGLRKEGGERGLHWSKSLSTRNAQRPDLSLFQVRRKHPPRPRAEMPGVGHPWVWSCPAITWQSLLFHWI